MKKYITIYLTAALGFLVACTSESLSEDIGNRGTAAQITGSIGSAPIVETKVTAGNGDNISYEKFENGDAIGFFSINGLIANNEQLIYNGGSFKGTNGDDALIWKEGTAQRVYAYYPYSTSSVENDTEFPISIWRNAETDKWKDGFEDFLAVSANNLTNGSLISLAFSHQFAMLIVKRGTGFDENNSDITVRLNYKIAKTAHISRKSASTPLLLQQHETEGIQDLTGTTGTYKPSNSSGPAEACTYTIIPVGDVYQDNSKLQNPVKMESVTLENNAGISMTIPLPTSINPLKRNTKYLVTVKMRDNQAVIDPEEICRWEEEPIHIEKPAGIETSEDLDVWMSTYNGVSSERDNILSRYGSYADGKWTFRLLSNITYTVGNIIPATVVTSFSDIFDGQGHTISGLKLSGSPNTGFFGTLSGQVKNLALKNIQVENTGETGITKYSGGIAGLVNNTGRISNCHITGDASLIVGVGYTGGLCGLLETGASITNCTSTAVVTGTESNTTYLLVGQQDGTLTGCSSTGTLITNP